MKTGKYPTSSLPKGAYDAVVVGAGPSGSTLGFFASKGGAKVSGRLETKVFVHDLRSSFRLYSNAADVAGSSHVSRLCLVVC